MAVAGCHQPHEFFDSWITTPVQFLRRSHPRSWQSQPDYLLMIHPTTDLLNHSSPESTCSQIRRHCPDVRLEEPPHSLHPDLREYQPERLQNGVEIPCHSPRDRMRRSGNLSRAVENRINCREVSRRKLGVWLRDCRWVLPLTPAPLPWKGRGGLDFFRKYDQLCRGLTISKTGAAVCTSFSSFTGR
jgi:hypothetical protein